MTYEHRYGKTNDLIYKDILVKGLWNLIKQSLKYTSNMTKGEPT